jgi:arylformamidase
MTKDPFRTRDHVDNFDAIVADVAVRSAATRAALPMVADLEYGPGADEKLDLFLPALGAQGLPVHIFIHGGYWRMFAKDDFSYVANSIVAAGAIAVIIDYSLMPGTRMGAIVEQVKRAGRWVEEHIAGFGGDASRMSVSGHSAGAHLATFLLEASSDGPRMKSAVLLGGLYDLKPLQSSFLEPLIGITDAEAAELSPLRRQTDPETVVSIAVGSEETVPFHQQAHDYARHLGGQGHSVETVTLAGKNHMTSMLDLGDPESETGRLITRAIEQSR